MFYSPREMSKFVAKFTADAWLWCTRCSFMTTLKLNPGRVTPFTSYTVFMGELGMHPLFRQYRTYLLHYHQIAGLFAGFPGCPINLLIATLVNLPRLFVSLQNDRPCVLYLLLERLLAVFWGSSQKTSENRSRCRVDVGQV